MISAFVSASDASAAPRTISSGAWSPPIASTTMRCMARILVADWSGVLDCARAGAALHRRRARLHLPRALRPDERLARRAQGGPAVDERGHADRRALRVLAHADAPRRGQRAASGWRSCSTTRAGKTTFRAEMYRRLQGPPQGHARRAVRADGVLPEDRARPRLAVPRGPGGRGRRRDRDAGRRGDARRAGRSSSTRPTRTSCS